MKPKNALIILLLLVIFSGLLLSEEKYNDNWPNWRGPNNDGVSLEATPPTEWSETKNVKWKTPIPGKGLGTPVVWGNQIFITTAIELDKVATKEAIKRLKKSENPFFKIVGQTNTTEHILQFIVYSIDRNSGEIIWQKCVREQYPHEGTHSTGSWASASCVTDGEYVIASFGSFGIYCFDLAGNMIWEKDLGDMQVERGFGEGTSPVIYKDKLIIIWDHEGPSKIHLFDKKTGKEIWQKDRDEKTTWATPIVVKVGNKEQIIVPGKGKSKGYNLENGDEIWNVGGLSLDVVPSPVFDGERCYLMTGFIVPKILLAINLKIAKGNIENSSAICWTSKKNTSYVPSPLLVNQKLYFLKGNRSQFSCLEAKSGEIYYEKIKPKDMGGIYASPVFANGNIYIIDRKGLCTIIKEGTEFQIITQNKLDDSFDASPVVVGNDLFLRGHKSLYCISK